jgi:hypothetical protein
LFLGKYKDLLFKEGICLSYGPNVVVASFLLEYADKKLVDREKSGD